MKTRIALNGNDGSWRIGIGERARWESHVRFAWNDFDAFVEQHAGHTRFVSISYELRKQVLGTTDFEECFPVLAMWVPENVYVLRNGEIVSEEGGPNAENRQLALECLEPTNAPLPAVTWNARQSKADYIRQVEFLQQQIQQGNCYEINYCQEFYAENVGLETITGVYHALNERTTAPFSLLLENDNWMIASASPERFIRRTGERLLSQPIKGTAPRGKTPTEDEQLRAALLHNKKERTENVMIVDLVRNDLSRVARKGTVNVDELFGVYTFPTVHQLISTISCELKPATTFSDILRALFPMGSMTGAPKVAAVDLAEQTERFTRGIYSGAIGYMEPNGDFDLNVMIRSLVYERASQYLSCGVGGAITIFSDPEAEYEECKTKVGRILETVGTWNW